MAPKEGAAAVRISAIPDDDPAWRAALAAPLDDEPETEEERRAIDEAMSSGEFVESATISAAIAARAARGA